jgi:calcium/calmodulin-dependent protein kinase (CaM kinase) II/calcium/calmodulin-dependent protein kinase I
MKLLIDVPGVIRLIDFFVTPTKFHVVQEWAEGGDIFDKLAKRTTYTEKDARDLSFVLLQTMQAMHSLHLVHRDLKPENLLLLNTFDDANIKVCDFGFAKHVPPEGLQTRCGTPAFVAPEILVGGRYKEQVDMWSVGVILYILLGGYPPFQDANHRGLFRKIRAADYVFHEAYWDKVSIEAKQLISSLLTVNADLRTTAEEALESAWIVMEDESLSSRDLSSAALLELRQFNARRKLKSAVHAVSWAIKAQFFNPDTVTFNQQLADWDKSDTKPPPKIKFLDVYELTTKIRKGSSATVWECKNKKSGETFAVKIIKREGLKASDDEAVMNEVAIVKSLDHPHVVHFCNFYEEPDYFFLVMELMAGGDVFDRVVQKTYYTELDARDLIRILLKAVEYIHSMGIAHRDLKPQNLLLTVSTNILLVFGIEKKLSSPTIPFLLIP